MSELRQRLFEELINWKEGCCTLFLAVTRPHRATALCDIKNFLRLDFETELDRAGSECQRKVNPVITGIRLPARRKSVVLKSFVDETGGSVHPKDIEGRCFCRISEPKNLPDPPQHFAVVSDIHNGGLVRKQPIDTSHVLYILRANFALVGYL